VRPPDDEGRPEREPANVVETVVITTTHTPALTKDQHHDHNGARRRYAASRRMPPLRPCGCVRDPDHDRHRCNEPPLSERMIDAGRDAARHIINTTGCTPLLELDVLAALYARGGDDRDLAQRLYDLAGGDA
jgi:hypothetical protein